MVTYAASLSLRFQEQEEAWVDARTAIGASAALLAAVRGRRLLARPDSPSRVLGAELEPALATAHAELERLATARQAALAGHTRRTLELELARADAYYRGAVESIERRRANAPADRLRLLESQSEATRAEWARRRRGIQDEHTARYEIRPFRLHLVHVPAFILPVEVRRGSRAFPLELAWIPSASAFSPVRCPSCGAADALLATRERLGCRACASAGARRPGTLKRT